jgi:poly(hydroxyalkanoate) granule-associated protein
MAEEVKQVVEETVDQVDEASADVNKAVKKAAKDVEKTPVVAEVKKATGSGNDGVVEQVKGGAKDVADKVIETAKDVQDSIEKSPVTVKAKQTVKDTAEAVQKSSLMEAVHKVLLAGIGAAALAQEEIEDFVNRLVERGEIAEADGKKMMKDVLEKRKQMVKMPAKPAVQPKKITSDIEKRIEDLMAKMNIPTKDEIDALSAKITVLTKKVDELKKSETSG